VQNRIERLSILLDAIETTEESSGQALDILATVSRVFFHLVR
jgi:hypothetical protein